MFAGQTNVGKSIFLGNIATNVAEQGKTVVLISLEMSELMYAKRISSKVTGINIGDLQTSSDLVKTRVEDITQRKKHTRRKLKNRSKGYTRRKLAIEK